MRHRLTIFFNTGHAILALIWILTTSGFAQVSVLKWDRDTIVEKEYQASYCQNNPERSTICSDAFSITNPSPQRVVIDSIFFKVTTPGIISSHSTLKFNQAILKFAYHYSGSQAGYPWIFSEYNESGYAKISINSFQKVDITAFEIDNCLYSCPVSKGASPIKLPITASLIFVSGSQRDTLTLIGLQNQEPSPINRNAKTGAYKPYSKQSIEYRNSNGRLGGAAPADRKRGIVFLFSD
jgi:hypothetical protein